MNDAQEYLTNYKSLDLFILRIIAALINAVEVDQCSSWALDLRNVLPNVT